MFFVFHISELWEKFRREFRVDIVSLCLSSLRISKFYSHFRHRKKNWKSVLLQFFCPFLFWNIAWINWRQKRETKGKRSKNLNKKVELSSTCFESFQFVQLCFANIVSKKFLFLLFQMVSTHLSCIHLNLCIHEVTFDALMRLWSQICVSDAFIYWGYYTSDKSSEYIRRYEIGNLFIYFLNPLNSHQCVYKLM